MSEISRYFQEKELVKKLQELTAWRDYYLQGLITWDALLKAKEEKKDTPTINSHGAKMANYKIEKINQRIDRLWM